MESLMLEKQDFIQILMMYKTWPHQGLTVINKIPNTYIHQLKQITCPVLLFVLPSISVSCQYIFFLWVTQRFPSEREDTMRDNE